MNELKCRDCEHYVVFYRKYDGRYVQMLEGICGNRKSSGHRRKTDKTCGEYKKIDLAALRETDDKSISKALHKIYLELEEIKHYIKD